MAAAMMHRRRLLAVPAALALAPPGLAMPAIAQPAWPTAPIRLVAPFPPGGSVDTIARLLQPALQEALGVPVVVENRSGASGSVGTLAVARAAPDGQTWGIVFDTHAVNQALIPGLAYDPRRDFTLAMLIGTSPMVIACPQARPWQRLEDVVAAARARPDSITYGTVGNGSLAHLTMELLQARAGIRLSHVPYRGGGPMSAAAAAGEIDLGVASRAGLGGQVGTTLRPLAQTGATRSAGLPQVPVLAEAGIADAAAEAFWALVGPAGIPPERTARIHAAFTRALQDPQVRQRLVAGQGIDIQASSPEGFARFLDAQVETWTALVRQRGIRAE